MSFRIFAYGSPKFHYLDPAAVDGGVFDKVKLIATISTTSPDQWGVGGTASNQVVPSTDVTDSISTYAQKEFLHNIWNAVNNLATRPDAVNGKITLMAKKIGSWSQGNSSADLVCNFGSDDPGREFMKKMADALNRTGLNSWGVLNAVGLVLNSFDGQLAPDGTPIIFITLTK